MLKPDLSSASLRIINAFEPTRHNFKHVDFEDYMICEDSLVSCWFSRMTRPSGRVVQCSCGFYTGLTSDRLVNVISHRGRRSVSMLLPSLQCNYSLSSCPISGRFVRLGSVDVTPSLYPDRSHSVAVLDFF